LGNLFVTYGVTLNLPVSFYDSQH